MRQPFVLDEPFNAELGNCAHVSIGLL
jgi:hypothetical protein